MCEGKCKESIKRIGGIQKMSKEWTVGYHVRPAVIIDVGSCETVTPDYRGECCEKQGGPDAYWSDKGCVFRGGKIKNES